MFKHYLTSALRHLLQHKLTTSINVVCLTIGLVCFLASYSMVTFLSAGDRHFSNADRIQMIRWSMDGSLSASAAPYLTGKHLRADMPELETVARATIDVGIRSEAPIAAGDRKSFANVAYADAEFLDVFALPFLAGDSKNALRSPRSAVISKDVAIRFFGSASAALGQNLRFQDGSEVTVRGVVGSIKQPSHIATGAGPSIGFMRFDVLASMDVLDTAPGYPAVLKSWTSPLFLTYAVLPKDGSFSAEDLRQRLASFGERYANSNGNTFKFGTTSVSEYWLSNVGVLFGSPTPGRAGLLMFYFLGSVVLLISCLNYANLATAHGAKRAKEIGMRRVVGANRRQIALQFFSEAALLSASAFVFAIVISALAIAVIGSPSMTAVALATLTTFKFWATLIVLLMLVTIAAGFYPALVLSSVRPIQAVRAGKVQGGGRFISRLLVGLQFAGASFLVITMLIMSGQNAYLKKIQFQHSPSALVSVANDVRAAGINFEVLKAELERQPHVKSVTATMISPWVLVGSQGSLATSPEATATKIPVMMNRVHYDYFSTLGIPFMAGRPFDRTRGSDSAGATQTGMIVDQAFAEQRGWVPVTEAIGKTFYEFNENARGAAPEPRTVVGVVETRASSILSPFGATASVYSLSPARASSPIIRISTDDVPAALKEIELVWTRLAPAVALKLDFADQLLNSSHKTFGVVSSVFGGVAVVALLISLLGLIGMSIDVIGRRLHEIGVRKTLGANVQSIVRLLLTDFSKPVIIANLLVWPMAFFAMQAYLGIFTQRTALSIAPFITSLSLVVLVAWIAVAAQATRAARMNPAAVLRYE